MRLFPEVKKKSQAAAPSREGELATSRTISAPSRASGRPSPVTVLTPEAGEAAITS
jgi:hypothetical protein